MRIVSNLIINIDINTTIDNILTKSNNFESFDRSKNNKYKDRITKLNIEIINKNFLSLRIVWIIIIIAK